MQYRRFGRTNLKIPVLSLGGMRFQKSWDQLEFSEISCQEQNKVENILNLLYQTKFFVGIIMYYLIYRT